MPDTLKEKQIVLRLDNVNRNFGGAVAASDICIQPFRGEIFGLAGPNGAGKTTLLNLITGIYMADGGDIYLDGREITRSAAHRRTKMDIARTFQHPGLLDRYDIRTNIFVGVDLAARRKGKNKDAEQELAQLLTYTSPDEVDLMDQVDQLAYKQQKMLEIVRATLCEPVVLLPDEPAVKLDHREMNYIVTLIGKAAERRIAVLLIEHVIDLVTSVCDRITVPNFGCQIATEAPKEIQMSEAVVTTYLGGGGSAEN